MSRFLARRPLPTRLRRPGRIALRRLLLAGVPVMIVPVLAYCYVMGGRFVTTENAYIKANMVQIATQVDGPITRVAVEENEPIKEGTVLFQVDPAPYRIALRLAQARVLHARSEIETLKASYRQAQAQLNLANVNAAYAQRQYQRQQRLARRDLTSRAQRDRYRHERDVAKERVATQQQELARIRAGLQGDPDIAVTQHPRYREAEAARDAAALELERTRIRAPFDGVAAKVPDRGTQATPGKPVMSLIAERGVWIEANFKETALTHIRLGQPVAIKIDTYPDRHWRGHVASVAQATGSEFSLLPPQNATGNWVKVVQRIPVRIAIDNPARRPSLRDGMSVTVEVDTGYHRRGPGFLAPALAWTRAVIGPQRADSGS